MGAAPRQRGSSEAWTLTAPSGATSSTSSGRMQPKATTQMTSGAAWRTASMASGVMRLVSSTGMPSSRARAFTGEGRSSLPRPRTASGRVTASATSWTAATAERDATAKSGVP